jgi:hypothetical protein
VAVGVEGEGGGISVPPSCWVWPISSVSKGWLRRGWDEDGELVFTLTATGRTAQELAALGNPEPIGELIA